MMENRISDAAELLRQASDMLLSVSSSSPASVQRPASERSDSPTTSSTPSTSNYHQGPRPTTRPEGRPIHETLARARNMMQSSRSTGVFRRLSSSERLRSTSGPKEKKSKRDSSTSKDKPVEFALLASENIDREESDDNLRKDMILDRGIASLNEKDDEAAIREKLVSSLKSKYNMIGKNDFEFVKVNQKKISVLHLSTGTEYNYDVIKKLVGQGLLYIRIKRGFEFVVGQNSDADSELANMPYFAATINDAQTEAHIPEHQNTPQADQSPLPAQPILTNVSQQPESSKKEQSSGDFFDTVVNELPSNITEPKEMLRYLQKKIVRGRPRGVTDSSSYLEGETNFITVDRENVIQTTFDELKCVEDPRVTFEVQFFEEQAVDSGGPRREWIRLCNQQMKIKYFDNGIKDHLSEDYFYVGQMIGIALLQNGQLPVFIPEEILQAIFVEKYEQLSPCVMQLKRGMDTLGVSVFVRKFPQLLCLLRPSVSATLSVRGLLSLLKPEFSEEGSNTIVLEKAVYAKFVKYVREVSSGRRVVTLTNILEFTTAASEEPPLGFQKPPNIQFVKVEDKEFTAENEVRLSLHFLLFCD